MADQHHYEIVYTHHNEERYTEVTNKKDIAGEVQALVDSPDVKIVGVYEVRTTRKDIDHKVPEPTEGSQAHVRLEAQHG